MLNNTNSYHTLFAGVTGSGKSFVIKNIIDTLISEANSQFVFIDPKKVELYQYRNIPGTIAYADNEDSIFDAIDDVEMIMDHRFDEMRDSGQTASDAPHMFVFVDEMAFLMQSTQRKEYIRKLSRIALLGRAAHIHLMLCTQVSTQDVIPACIRDNMTNIVCLRQRDAGKYRYLLGSAPGRLPMYGYAYILTPDMERPEKVKSEDVWSRLTA